MRIENTSQPVELTQRSAVSQYAYRATLYTISRDSRTSSSGRGVTCLRPIHDYQPFTFVRTRTRFLSAVMYNVLPSSPNARFAVATPVASVPRCLPCDE